MTNGPGGLRPAWRFIADWCREHPEEWAMVKDKVGHYTATHIKQGRNLAFRPAGDFQAMIRNGDGQRGTLFVRYSPDDNPLKEER
jgi:hypothetical protein